MLGDYWDSLILHKILALLGYRFFSFSRDGSQSPVSKNPIQILRQESLLQTIPFHWIIYFQERFNKYLRVCISASVCCMEVSLRTLISELKREKWREGKKKIISLLPSECSPIFNTMFEEKLEVTSQVQKQWSYCICCH